jgi:CheY-like chemotaxis protein
MVRISLREMASMISKRLWHQMVVTQDGPEALKPWPQHRWKIDLLPPDTAMPGGISGRELADHLLRAPPYPRL